MLTLLHSERPKLHRVLAVLSAKGLRYTSEITVYKILIWGSKLPVLWLQTLFYVDILAEPQHAVYENRTDHSYL